MAFEDIQPMEMADEGAEDQEVAAPENKEAKDTGAEAPEVAAPESDEPDESGKTASDARFAEMRRKLEEAERERAEAQSELENLKAQQEARRAALANMDVDEIDAIAEQLGITREEVLENIEREEEAAEAEIQSKEKDQTIADLQARIDEIEAEKAMAEDLSLLRKIDPGLSSLEELGDDYFDYISAGLSAEQAYYAIKGKEINTKSTPAKPPGRITDVAPPAKDYFTEEEVANMTSQEKYENAEKIMASLPKWRKK